MFLRPCTSLFNAGRVKGTKSLNKYKSSIFNVKDLFDDKQNSGNLSLKSESTWKQYEANESGFAHNIMSEFSDKYVIAKKHAAPLKAISRNELLKYNQDITQWNSKTSTEMIEYLKSLCNYAANDETDLCSKTSNSFFIELGKIVKDLNENELGVLLTSLNNLPRAQDVENRNIINSLYRELDDAMISKMKDWNSNKLLLFSDYIYHAIVPKKHLKYTSLALDTLACNKLTSQQLVQTLFYVSTWRRQPDNIRSLEKSFKNSLNTLTIDEIGICCMGFFKSKTRLTDDIIVEKLIDKIIAEAETVSDITLSAILKLIRYSTQKYNKKLPFLLDSLVTEIPRLSFLACVHVALVGTTSLLAHRQSLAALEKKVIHSAASARLKDLERLAYVFSTFVTEANPSLFRVIVEELRSPSKSDEIAQYGSCLANCLSYLVINGTFPEDLISNVLHKDFIAEAYRDSPLSGRGLTVLDLSVEIECENYKGNRLNIQTKNMLIAEYQEQIPNLKNMLRLNFNQKYMFEVMCLIGQIRGGNNFIFTGHLLPHFVRAGKYFTFAFLIRNNNTWMICKAPFL